MINILTRIFRKIQSRFRKTIPVRFLRDAYPVYDIGYGSYGDLSIHSYDPDDQLSIGQYCSFARGSHIILGGEHRVDWVSTYPFSAIDAEHIGIKGHPLSKGPVCIGSDVWVGFNAMIVSGITIGDGAVIAAGAVITKDVPPYAIVGGNPAKPIRYRFDPETINKLMAIKRWDWDKNRINKTVRMLLNSDIDAFISGVEAGEI